MKTISELMDEFEDINQAFMPEKAELSICFADPQAFTTRFFATHLGHDDYDYVELTGFKHQAISGEVEIHSLMLKAENEQHVQEILECSRYAAEHLPQNEFNVYGVPANLKPETCWLFCLFHYMKKHKQRWVVILEKDREGNEPSQWFLRKPGLASIEYLKYLLKGVPKSKAVPQTAIVERNKKAWNLLRKNPDIGITELAQCLGCSVGTACKTTAWKDARSKKEKTSKPKVVNLSDKMLQVTGNEGKELKAAIRDHWQYRESSPLDPNGRSAKARKEL